MRMLFVIITGLTLIFFITVSWYFSQAMVVSISVAIMASLSSDAASVLNLAQFCSIVWGPAFDIIIIIWMIASAQVRDAESEIYG